jgi:uncharacterized protein (TIGR00297 family)
MSNFVIGLVAAGAIGLAAARIGFLKPSGAWGAFLLGTVVFGLGGLFWSIPLLVFFILGSLLSKYSPKRRRAMKEGLDLIFEKGSTRDAAQVWANGGIAGLVVIANALHPSPSLFIAYCGALAAAAADTWGTEIGVLGRGRTLSVLTLRPVARGTSGGISMVGTLGAAAGALSVALAGAFSMAEPLRALAVIVVAGIAGMFVDSVVGATLQARYRCVSCGAITERREHCGLPSELIGGIALVNNDVVNTACTLAGAVVGWVLGGSGWLSAVG